MRPASQWDMKASKRGAMQSTTRTNRWATAAVLSLGLATAVDRAAAEVYIYELPGGSRMITDHPMSNKQYKLVRKSENVRGMGSLINNRYAATVLADTTAYDKLIRRFATQFAVDAALVKAVIHAESGFNPHAVSRAGAQGLMQLMPGTAERYGVEDAFDARQNISGGVRYLRDLLVQFRHNRRLALAAYNAGENAVVRHRGIPPYAETQTYVQRVLGFHARYRPLFKPAGAPTPKTRVVMNGANS